MLILFAQEEHIYQKGISAQISTSDKKVALIRLSFHSANTTCSKSLVNNTETMFCAKKPLKEYLK